MISMHSTRCTLQLRTHAHAAAQPNQSASLCKRPYMMCRAVSSAQLLHGLQSDSQFHRQLEDPGFQFVVNSHVLLHDIVSQKLPLDRAATKGWCCFDLITTLHDGQSWVGLTTLGSSSLHVFLAGSLRK